MCADLKSCHRSSFGLRSNDNIGLPGSRHSSSASPEIRKATPGRRWISGTDRSHEKVLTSTASCERGWPYATFRCETIPECARICCPDKMAKERRNCRTNEDNLAVAAWVTATRTNDSRVKQQHYRQGAPTATDSQASQANRPAPHCTLKTRPMNNEKFVFGIDRYSASVDDHGVDTLLMNSSVARRMRLVFRTVHWSG